jgi:pilin isopeptide linkage protein
LLDADGETHGKITFDFKIEPAEVEANQTLSSLPLKSGVALGDDYDTVTATFDNSDYTSGTDGYNLTKVDITKDLAFDFSKVAFTGPGVYRYNVYEDTSNAYDEISYDAHDKSSDTAVFTVDVYVLDSNDTYSIQSYVIYDGTEKLPLAFLNEWDCGNLIIKKVVTEGKGNKNADFSFKLTIPIEGDTIDLPETGYINAEIYYANGTVARSQKLEVGDDGTEFTLKSGQYLKIQSLPEGMIYTVEELNATDYVTTIKATDATGTLQEVGTAKTYNGTIKCAGSSKDENIADNEVEFTNEREIVPDSGIVLNIAPYVIVLILAVGGAVVFFARKKNSAK